MARSWQEQIQGYGWKLATIVFDVSVLAFLIRGIMSESSSPVAVVWSLSTVAWVGGRSVDRVAQAIRAMDFAESITVIEGSHLWFRLRDWLDRSNVAQSLSGVELLRVGTTFTWHIWSDDFTARFEKPAEADYKDGAFTKPEEGSKLWPVFTSMKSWFCCKQEADVFILKWELDKGWASAGGTWKRAGKMTISSVSRRKLEEFMTHVHNAETPAHTRPRTADAAMPLEEPGQRSPSVRSDSRSELRAPLMLDAS